MIKEIEPKQFLRLVKNKFKRGDFTPIVLFGETCSGKTTLCNAANKACGKITYESYSLYALNTKRMEKNKKHLMREICDLASMCKIQVFSSPKTEVAIAFGKAFGLPVYQLNDIRACRGIMEFGEDNFLDSLVA